MKRNKKKYSQNDGLTVEFFLKKTISPSAQLIGSLLTKGASNNDIDIYLPNIKKTTAVINKLKKLLEPTPYSKRKDGSFSEDGVTHTDWGGAFFHNTFFGDIDIFFKGCTKDFDY